MISHRLMLILLASFIRWICCVQVNIKIEPDHISLGEDLSITCTIIEDQKIFDKGFKTLLQCPLKGKEEYCISNCDSLDKCSYDSCDRKKIGDQKFQCDLIESPSSLIYKYKFTSISEAVVKNRTQLPFKCFFKGQGSLGVVNIVSHPQVINPDKKEEIVKPSSKVKVNLQQNSNKKIETDYIIQLNDLILILLISCFFVSFLANIWCCMQCCIRRYNIRMSRRKMKRKQIKYDFQDSNHPEITSQYYTHDYIKRAKSHPTLSHNDRNIPARFVSCNINQLNSNTMSDKSRFRNSIHNSTAMEEEDMNRGSNHSILNSLYGQMVIAPVQCLDPAIVPYLPQLSHLYLHQNQMSSEHRKSQQNSEIFLNQDIIDRPDTSLLHPLPQKPQ